MAALDTKAAEVKMEDDKKEAAKRRLSTASVSQEDGRRGKEGRRTAAAAGTEKKEAAASSATAKSKEEKEADRKKRAKESIDKKRKEVDFRAGQRKFMALLLKQVLRLSQQGRDISSIVIDTFIIKAEEEEVKAMKLQMVAYNQLEDENKGPPHLYAFAGLMIALLKRGESLGAKNLKDLQALKDDYDLLELEQRGEAVRFCRVDKMWRQDMKRLSISVSEPRVAKVVAAALVQAGALRKQGRGPSTFMERELQEFMEALAA
jgi:hypothetical protein